MTILTKNQIIEKNIVAGADNPDSDNVRGWNATSYDSRVGIIITKDGIHDKDTYKLPQRGIAWVISQEDYCLPNTVTGITTLKTGWTKSGVLTLTSGIVDPGYKGPISTAVINFSKIPFPIVKGEEFFRTVFITHEEVDRAGTTVTRDKYIEQVLKDSGKSAETFLTFEDFGKEMQEKVFQLPRFAFIVTIIGLAIALIALILPAVLDLSGEIKTKNAEISVLQGRVSALEEAARNHETTTDRTNQKLESTDEAGSAGVESVGAEDQRVDPVGEGE